mgnify:CR=1 FL=1
MIARRHMYRLLVTVLILAGAAVASGCSSGDGDSKQIEVTARDFSFDPTTVTVVAGERYRVVFRNAGNTLHDWTVDGVPVREVVGQSSGSHDMTAMKPDPSDGRTRLHTAAEGGKTAEVVFTPTLPGEYEYWCTVPGHRELGMRGKLVVRA